MTEPEEILEFWFGPLTAGFSRAALRSRWFAANPDFDQLIALRFGASLEAAHSEGLAAWRDTPRGCLAFILITDQFSRQIHRGSAQAFATDALALEAARRGLERNYDVVLGFDERAFLYLPFEHSESLADQKLSVILFKQLRDATPKPYRHLTGQTLRYAKQHHDIIARYGRFPHRNLPLGRVSTDAELQFLGTTGRFGQ